MENKLSFNKYFFQHVIEYKLSSNKKKAPIFLRLLYLLFRLKTFVFFLYIFENIFSFILSLPVPIYKDLIYMFITYYPGLPGFAGCYLRSIYYKNKIKVLSSNVIIECGVTFYHPELLELCEFCFIDKNVIIAASKAKIGKRVHIAPNVIITGGGEFIIEDYACIATGSKIITATESLKEGTRSSGPMVPFSQRDIKKGIVIIKKDAFIGAGAIILTNVTIAQGSVVGSGTTILKDTEPWKVYVSNSGAPRILKDRPQVTLPDV